MSQEQTMVKVTLDIERFAPKPAKERARGGSPFARRSSSPFAGSRRPRGKQWTQSYELHVSPDATLLDCLMDIKRNADPSLSFRYSCGHGMCGSDAVAVNGAPTLLCTAKVRDYASALQPAHGSSFRKTGEPGADEPSDGDSQAAQPLPDDLGSIAIGPLPGFPVLRDLIVDIDPMLDQIRRLQPFLQNDGILATTVDGKVDVFEYLQRPEQLKRYEALTNCIMCGVCEGACPVYAGGDAFAGPAALINEARFVDDSRDLATARRLEMVDTADGVQACQSVRACSRPCPKGIDVGEEIWQLIAQVRQRDEAAGDGE